MEVANETGVIMAINRQLMLEAFQQLRRWQDLSPSGRRLTMSVNVSPKQFQQPDLTVQIGQIIQQSGVDPNCVNLEITETTAILQIFAVENLAASLHCGSDDEGVVPRELMGAA